MSTWVGSAGNFNTVSAFTVTLPAFQAGDLAILVAGGDSATDPNFGTPAGWTFRAKTGAGNMFSYIWSRVLQSGDTTVAIDKQGAAAVGVWRDATLGTIGAFGIRSGTIFTVPAPDIAGTTSYRAHIYSERSTAAVAGELDALHTVTYGTARAFYGANPAIGAATGIDSVYFSDSAPGQSGINTATMKDSSGNAWGIQIDLGAGAPVDLGLAIKVSDGTQLKDTKLKVSDGTKLYTPRGIKKVKLGYTTVTDMLATTFYCGHRGGSRDWPEMSLFGYGQAAIYDYGALELSLARTSDGVWFGLHDQYLDRTSLGTATTTLNPAAMTWAQVQGYQILGSTAPNNPTQPNRPYMRWEELLNVYYHTHVILADIKYASAHTFEFLDKLDALPGNPRERIVGKSFGVSGAADNSSGFAKEFAARGYKTWGYFYETNQADFVNFAPRWTFLGMDYTASQASWDALKAAGPGKKIMGHICPDQAAVNTAQTKGANGFQVSSPINVRPT